MITLGGPLYQSPKGKSRFKLLRHSLDHLHLHRDLIFSSSRRMLRIGVYVLIHEHRLMTGIAQKETFFYDGKGIFIPSLELFSFISILKEFINLFFHFLRK